METLGDAVISGDFEVVLMGNNAQVCYAAQRSPRVGFVRDVEVVFGMSKLHRNATMHGKTESAKSIPALPPNVWTKAPATP
jgi:hypothetical protein